MPEGSGPPGAEAGSISSGAAGKLTSAAGSSGASGASGGAVAGGRSGAGGLSGSGGAGQPTAGQATSGSGGALSNEAEAQLVATAGMASGTVHFTARGEQVEMVVSLLGCPSGLHGLHLHANPACGDSANAAGGHWSPQGEVIPDISCAADGTAQLSFLSEPGVWTLGAPASSDLLQHAVVLHAGPSDPDPGARIACGIAKKLP